MLPRLLPLLALLPLTAFAERSARDDNADAPPSTPEQQRAMFHLPPGFEIQLVADETQIQKPMNLNFDSAGRLWVTGSELYPWPAKVDALGQPIANFDETWQSMAGAFDAAKAPPPPERANDTVRVLSDFAPDGRARKVEVFADGLNIPVGIIPLPRKHAPLSADEKSPATSPENLRPSAKSADPKGDSIIVFSIPKIWRLTDTDGDGRADLREPLYGDFGFRDTHGMSSNYLYWIDGWIYGCHGFANHSLVKDASGHVTEMNSGNTYRFRPDGSRFEIYTHGQTNPFGLAVDDWGNFYSADSHSKPVMMLLPGAYYAGIGKTHDGLGFAPTIMDHDHGSSAIAGVAWYGAKQFPAEFYGNTFNGNPVTRRINRDRYEWHGSTPKAIEMPDFLTCDDPWFRPVQVKLGPDGALWIADFYTPIIGHYEQPLADPRRDHTHGRIWRIVYRGENKEVPVPAVPDLTKLDLSELEGKERDSNITVSHMAQHQIAALEMECACDRLGPMTAERFDSWLELWKSLPDKEMFVRTARVVVGEKLRFDQLFQVWRNAPPGDTGLIYTIRAALRDKLVVGGYDGVKELIGKNTDDTERVADISLAVPTEESAIFLLDHLRRTQFALPRAGEYLRHVVRHLPDGKLGEMSVLLKPPGDAPLSQRLTLADGLAQAAHERNWELPADLATQVKNTIFAALENPDVVISNRAIAALHDVTWPEKIAPLERIIFDPKQSGARRTSALEAAVNVGDGLRLAKRALADLSSLPLRKKAAELLGQKSDTGVPPVPGATTGGDARATLLAALPTAPAELALSITASLAKTDADFTALLDLLEAGKASPAPLRNRLVANLLPQRAQPLRIRADTLTKNLPPEDERLDKIIAQRVKAFGTPKPDPDKGAQIFAQQCAVCHRFRGQGGNVGPNLDGVVARGAHRLVEDILDPNRNVDPTFRQTTLELQDGRLLVGVNLREEGTAVLLTDAAGQTQSVPKETVKSQTQSRLSLMPPAFETAIPPDDFNALLSYLLR